ncbi:hypothetical protein M407DRAFT_22038 [Tulasnella calospora MUT 4182]|uniref:Uncharacterized protein n=1 Tax=Tulasnella calospora MUT 4182 TaxID=1051891 RepID=A0A0C3QD33_9AGAM|nr:hypothetical protein M407DRAFT_22038 [Tulasnella calospora MUT 4182]
MAGSVPPEVWLLISQKLRALDNPLPRGFDPLDFSWPDWDNRRIMYSPSLTHLSCISRRFRIMLESKVFQSIRLRFNSIEILYHDSKAPEDRTFYRILSFDIKIPSRMVGDFVMDLEVDSSPRASSPVPGQV